MPFSFHSNWMLDACRERFITAAIEFNIFFIIIFVLFGKRWKEKKTPKKKEKFFFSVFVHYLLRRKDECFRCLNSFDKKKKKKRFLWIKIEKGHIQLVVLLYCLFADENWLRIYFLTEFPMGQRRNSSGKK